ncbi:Hypothetical_protein [Hexamita inflata]|uniref:Hypothetical_protein n=1 Tax=Hexamita inflata TaxID=28002 RepID=A0AA86TET0_9EUKA|nr:Hypothetical protein HINF_LOCUS1877 [Hexamita inflata]
MIYAISIVLQLGNLNMVHDFQGTENNINGSDSHDDNNLITAIYQCTQFIADNKCVKNCPNSLYYTINDLKYCKQCTIFRTTRFGKECVNHCQQYEIESKVNIENYQGIECVQKCNSTFSHQVNDKCEDSCIAKGNYACVSRISLDKHNFIFCRQAEVISIATFQKCILFDNNRAANASIFFGTKILHQVKIETSYSPKSENNMILSFGLVSDSKQLKITNSYIDLTVRELQFDTRLIFNLQPVTITIIEVKMFIIFVSNQSYGIVQKTALINIVDTMISATIHSKEGNTALFETIQGQNENKIDNCVIKFDFSSKSLTAGISIYTNSDVKIANCYFSGLIYGDLQGVISVYAIASIAYFNNINSVQNDLCYEGC